MKPEDVKYPFIDTEKRIDIIDRIWYIPGFLDKTTYEFPGWEASQLFGNSQPIKIEYCSGNGTWIAEKAKNDSLSNWVAVELRFDRIRKIRAKVTNMQLPNLLPVFGEAYSMTKHYIPNSSVSEVYVNFPDPWPKRRHERHRLFQPAFIEELKRILMPNGFVMVVTDDATYSKQLIKTFQQNEAFKSRYSDPYYITEFEGYGSSFFDDLWRSRGCKIHYHIFDKNA